MRWSAYALVAVWVVLALSLMPAGEAGAQEQETPVPWATAVFDTPTPQPPEAATEVIAPVPEIDTATSTATETETALPSPTPPSTFTPFSTSTHTSIPTHTHTSTATHTPSITPTATATPTATSTWLPPGPECVPKPGKAVMKLDVPYIHQVRDIGGADGNWACGPTSAVMVLAYYGMLEPWDVYVAREVANGAPQIPIKTSLPTPPSGGTSAVAAGFAPYVTNVYSNRGKTYDTTARDPRSNEVAGLYGYICPTGLADWGRMIQVFEWHGLSSKRIGASWESIVAALKRGHPVLIGNRLTAVGHVLVAIGYTNNKYLIVNDPYGNRFAPGYGATIGKDLYYSWNCMRPTSALEVIGIYPPLTHTPTVTPTPTETPVPPTATPTGTNTPTPMTRASTSAGGDPPFHIASFGALTARGATLSGGREPLAVAPQRSLALSAGQRGPGIEQWLLPLLAVALGVLLWLDRLFGRHVRLRYLGALTAWGNRLSAKRNHEP